MLQSILLCLYGSSTILFLLLKLLTKNLILSCAVPSKLFQKVNYFFTSEFTKWNKIDIKGPMTLEELKNHFEKTYSIEVSMITYGTSTVFSSYGSESKKRLTMKVEQAIENVTKRELPKWRKILPVGISGNTAEGVDCILPDVRYHI